MDSNELLPAANLVALMPFVRASHNEAPPTAEVEGYIESLECLAKSGFKTIELGQLPLEAGGVLEAALSMASSWHGLRLPVTVFDIESMGAALELGVKEVSVQLAPSNELSKRYFGASVADRLRQLEPIFELAGAAQVAVRGHLVSAFPGVSDVDTSALVADAAFYAKQLVKAGCFEVVLVDSEGVASGAAVDALFSALNGLLPLADVAVRFSNQNGQALLNTMAALECGVATVDVVSGDSEVSVSSHDLLFGLESKAVTTNINEQQLAQVSEIQEKRSSLLEQQRLASVKPQPLRLVSNS